MINIFSSSRYKINRKSLKIAVGKILSHYGLINHGVINIVFVGRQKMKSISIKYKKENVALPVLSFSYLDQKQPERVEQSNFLGGKTSPEDMEHLLGEVFICYPQAVLLAAQREKKVDDILLQLIKHGIENILK